MPTGVYDDQDMDARERNPAQAHQENLVNPDYVARGLEDLERHANSSAERGNVTNPGASKTEAGADGAGEQPGSTQKEADSDKAGKQPRTRLGKAWSGVKDRYGERAGKLLKNKWFVGFGIGGGAGAGLLVLLLIMLAAYQVPNLMENITKYQFSQVIRRLQTQNERTITAKLASSTANSAAAKKINDRYGKYTEKLNKWSVNKQIAALQTGGGPVIVENANHKITAVTLSDKAVLKLQPKFYQKLIPGYKFVNDVKLARQFVPEMQIGLRANEVGPITRYRVSNELMDRLKISRVAWKIGQYTGKSRAEVRAAVEQETARRVRENAPNTSSMQSDKDAARERVDGQDQDIEDLSDPNKLEQTLKNGGVSERVKKILAGLRKPSLTQTALSGVNDAYAIAAPICIVYEGSMSKSGPTVDANSNAQMKAAINLGVVGDQIKNGETVDPVIANAYATKLGDINDANAMVRANGKSVNTTNNSLSPQASASGSFTLFNATFGQNFATGAVNGFADKACPVLLSDAGAVGGAIGSLALTVASGGGVKAVSKAASTAVTKVAKNLITKGARKEALAQLKGGSAKIGVLLGTTAKSAGKIAATTLLARQIVASQAGEFNLLKLTSQRSLHDLCK